jgi:hypothetical protein
MEMMFAINKNNFDGHQEVTCHTCHRGSAYPLATPWILAGKIQIFILNLNPGAGPGHPGYAASCAMTSMGKVN